MKKSAVFLLVLALVLNSMWGICFAEAYKTVTIGPGQSLEFRNNSSTGASIFQKGSEKYDCAEYNADGTVYLVSCLEAGAGYVPAKGHTVITVPSTSKAIVFEYDSDKLSYRAAGAPALKKVTIQPGSNYEFKNKGSKDEIIRQWGKDVYDYIEYGSDGRVDSIDVATYGLQFIPSNGRLIISVRDTSPSVTLYTAYEHFSNYLSASETANPAIHKVEVNPGESYEFKNNGSTDEYIRTVGQELYDYIIYKEDGTAYYSEVSYSRGVTVPAGYRLVLTLLSTSDSETFYIPYEAYSKSFSISKSSNPAVYKIDIEPGESCEFVNTGSADAKIYASWHEYYEIATYNSKNNYSYFEDSSSGSKTISPGERFIVTIPSFSETVSFYTGYETYSSTLKINASDEPALYKLVVLPGQSYEFKHIGTDYARINQSGENKYKYGYYSKNGNLIDSSDSYSGSQSLFSGEKLVVSVPAGSGAVTFYSGFEVFKKSFDPNIVPYVDTFLYKQLDQAKDKEEVLDVLKTSFALIPEKSRSSDNIKEHSIRFAEQAIKKISSEELTATNNVAQIESDIVKKQVQKVKEAIPEVEDVLEESGIEKNRDIKTSIKINIGAETPDVDVVINENLPQDASGVDSIDFNTGEVQISMETANLQQEFGESSKITVSVDKEEEQNPEGSNSIVLASTGTYLGPVSQGSTPTQSKKYKISFKAEDGSEIKSLNNNIGLDLPAASSEGEYNCVFMVDGEKTEAVGGRYNPATNKLSIKTKKGAEYYVVENKKSFDDIEKKDASMKKAIEVMAAKGIINGRDVGKFDPDASINRSEFATLIVRAIYKHDGEAKVNFTDVQEKAWYYLYVASAKKEGIINGYPDNTFKPQNIINKQEIITICASVLNNQKGFYYPKDEEKYLEFSDNDKIPQWARKFVALANREGIVVKRRDEKFVGDQPFTRGDAAVILYRLFNRL